MDHMLVNSLVPPPSSVGLSVNWAEISLCHCTQLVTEKLSFNKC